MRNLCAWQILFTLIFGLTLGWPVSASSPDLFTKGKETFLVKNTADQTPEYKLLDGGGSEESIASLANAAMHWPNVGYVDIKIESLMIEPKNKTSDVLFLSAKISGKELEIEPTASRQKFLAGDWIEIHFPKKIKNWAF